MFKRDRIVVTPSRTIEQNIKEEGKTLKIMFSSASGIESELKNKCFYFSGRRASSQEM